MKRAFDIVASGLGLLVLLPLFVVVAVAVKLTSKGPVFFLQQRVGLAERLFNVIKFRTMVQKAELLGRQITAAGDARVTAVGQILRAFKLDELPQLLNVVRGDMSLVGPRPEVPRYVALYTAEQRRVLQVRPGITDWASIVYRHEEELLAMASDPERVYVQEIMPRKIALNLAYLRKRRGVLSDFAVVMGTLRALLPGAHEDRGLAESADLSTSPLAPESAQGMEAARRQ